MMIDVTHPLRLNGRSKLLPVPAYACARRTARCSARRRTRVVPVLPRPALRHQDSPLPHPPRTQTRTLTHMHVGRAAGRGRQRQLAWRQQPPPDWPVVPWNARAPGLRAAARGAAYLPARQMVACYKLQSNDALNLTHRPTPTNRRPRLDRDQAACCGPGHALYASQAAPVRAYCNERPVHVPQGRAPGRTRPDRFRARGAPRCRLHHPGHM